MAFLFFIGNTFGQQHPVDIIYSYLDEFLEEGNPENLTKLQRLVDTISVPTKEVQLARTIAYCNIGFVEAQAGTLQEAIDSYEKAENIYFSENLANYDIIEYCLKPLGNLYIKIQALSEAENTIKQYILLAKETGQSEQEIAGIVNLSVLYYSRGEFEKSKLILLQAMKKEPDNQTLKLNLASTFFALKQEEEAKELLKDILSLSSKNVRAFQLLAQVYLREKQYDKAIFNLKEALKLTKDNPQINTREVAKLHISLAETYLADEQLMNSLSEFQAVYQLLIPSYNREQQLPHFEQLFAETTLMDALDLHAVVFSKMGEFKKALTAFELASQVNDFLFAQLYMQDSKLIFQQSVKRRSESMLDLFYQQYQTTQEFKWVEKAISLDSKTKGRIVSDEVYLKKSLDSKNGENVRRFRELQEKLVFLGNEIGKQSQRNDLDFQQLASLQKSYSQTLTQQRILYDSLYSKIPQLNQSSDDLNKIREKAISSNQTLVSYFMGSESVYQFVISEENVTFIKLTKSKDSYEDFRESIRNYSRFFESPSSINDDIPKFVEESYQLYTQLKLPQGDNLIIIPDGILSFTPFQTLLTASTQSRDYSQMPFLLFKSSVSYLLSLGDYLRDKTLFDKEQSVLGVFPIFKDTPQELAYSLYEAQIIEKLFPSKILRDKNATREAFLSQCNQYSILHISTHAVGGTFNEPGAIEFFDGRLNVEELYGLYLKTNLVVLSACDTGIGKIIKGEGPLSLARAFQYAGAENVLFSLWQVNDKSTSEIMAFYYKNLKELRSRDFALHNAGIDYLSDESIDNPRKSPYYWGAFVYYGSTDVPHTSSNLGYYLIGIGILLIIILLVRFKKSKRKLPI